MRRNDADTVPGDPHGGAAGELEDGAAIERAPHTRLVMGTAERPSAATVGNDERIDRNVEPIQQALEENRSLPCSEVRVLVPRSACCELHGLLQR